MPVSLLTSTTDTTAVPSSTASASRSRSTVPAGVAGTRAVRKPSCSSRLTAPSTALCSMPVVTTPLASPRSRAAHAAPFTARLSPSLPPPVNTISCGRAPHTLATTSRASSRAVFERRDAAWPPEGFAKDSARNGCIAAIASGRTGVDAAWSRYAMTRGYRREWSCRASICELARSVSWLGVRSPYRAVGGAGGSPSPAQHPGGRCSWCARRAPSQVAMSDPGANAVARRDCRVASRAPLAGSCVQYSRGVRQQRPRISVIRQASVSFSLGAANVLQQLLCGGRRGMSSRRDAGLELGDLLSYERVIAHLVEQCVGHFRPHPLLRLGRASCRERVS